jgi:hypothetical protein
MGKGSVREGYRARLPRRISTHRFQYVWIRRPIFEELPLDPNECPSEGKVKMEAARGETCASQNSVSAGQKSSSKTSVQFRNSAYA